MEYQYARIKALEDKVQQLEKQNKDLSWLLSLTEQELCESKKK
jgi:cell shape-determining protein MreC